MQSGSGCRRKPLQHVIERLMISLAFGNKMSCHQDLGCLSLDLALATFRCWLHSLSPSLWALLILNSGLLVESRWVTLLGALLWLVWLSYVCLLESTIRDCGIWDFDQCDSQLFVIVTKYLRQSTYTKERFILAHSFGSFSPWLVGPIVISLCL
jgi:hypothetical protein